MLRIFVYDCRVFKMAQVKHSNRSICSHRCKHITTSTSYRKNVYAILGNKCGFTLKTNYQSFPKHMFLPLLNAMSYTSLSWAISCVLTCPVTMLTLPITCPVSSPHIVHVVSILEVPFENKNSTIKSGFQASVYNHKPNYCRKLWTTIFLPSKFGSTSFQSNEVRGAQKSEFLLLFKRHSSLVSGSPALHTLR